MMNVECVDVGSILQSPNRPVEMDSNWNLSHSYSILFDFQLRENSTTIFSMENFALHWTWKVALTDSMAVIIQVDRGVIQTEAIESKKNPVFLVYVDWACGGQWNRAYQFVQLLTNAFTAAHIDVIAFFDGTLKENKKNAHDRNELRQKTASVLKHIRMIGTPPPKIWWMPPSGLRTCLRNALRSLNVVVVRVPVQLLASDLFIILFNSFFQRRYKPFATTQWKSSNISTKTNSMPYSV